MRGISPLVAVVLLIAFVVSLTALVSGWLTSYIRGMTSNISETSSRMVGCSGASIEIEHIYIDSAAGTAKMLIENTGSVDLVVKGIIVDVNGNSCSNQTGISVTKGSIVELYFENCSPMNRTTFSRAAATTNCAGVGDEVTSLDRVTIS